MIDYPFDNLFALVHALTSLIGGYHGTNAKKCENAHGYSYEKCELHLQ